MESNLSEGISAQIKATRDLQGMTQSDLAITAGMSQNNLSRLENPDYGKQSLTSLKRIADALDIALVVRLVPFSQYIDWLSGTGRMDEGLSPNSLAVPSFDKEEKENLLESRQSYGQVTSITVGVTVAIQVGATISTWKPFMYEQNQPAQVVSGSPERIEVGEPFDRAIIPTSVNQPTPEGIYARI